MRPPRHYAAFLVVLIIWSLGSLVQQATGQNTASQPPEAAQQLQAAVQLVNSGQVEEGIAALERVTQDFPEFVRGWGTMGNIKQRTQDYDGALQAFLKASEISNAPQFLYSVGLSYAFLDQDDQAFEWLLKAKETGAVLLNNIDRTPAAANIRTDTRYSMLFPTEAEYSDPFVEGNRIIQDWYGENIGDTFGWIARNIGDVDGDGINDVTTSSPGFNNGAGKVFVFSSSTGKQLWSVEGSAPGGRLGHGIEAAGDVNADGIPDVVAAAPYINQVNVYSGRDGTELFSLAGRDTTGAFGLSVKGIGDINGDGHSDILVGEPFQVWGGPFNGGTMEHPGKIHIYSGKDQSELFTAGGEAPGDGFGSAVSGISHKNGFTFVIGAPAAGSSRIGKAYVFTTTDGPPTFEMEADSGGASFGSMFLSVVGDLNGDGFQDTYISDWADNTVAPGSGKVYLYSGKDGSRMFTLEGTAAGEGFGIGISDAGDVDKDGYDDLVVGGWQNALEAPSAGKLYIHSGKDGALLYVITGKVAGETLGYDTTGLGDVDGDGFVDFLITSASSAKNGAGSGRTLIISGKPPSAK